MPNDEPTAKRKPNLLCEQTTAAIEGLEPHGVRMIAMRDLVEDDIGGWIVIYVAAATEIERSFDMDRLESCVGTLRIERFRVETAKPSAIALSLECPLPVQAREPKTVVLTRSTSARRSRSPATKAAAAFIGPTV